MGAAAHLVIAGEKGGEKKPKTPVEAPDSLRSTNIAKILLAVGEGEFDGTPTARDIYLDNTPIMDASGNLNFPGVKWEWRPGSVEQEYIKGIPSIENETTVNVELRSDNPFTRALSNTQLSRLRLRFAWPRLARQDKSSGDTNGYRIEYAIDIATDGGAFVESLRGAVDGKTTSGYQRSEPVILPPATSGWSFRVRRLTPNANDGLIADTMTIAGYTEIIDQKIRYPNTALLYIEFDAEQFQNIPAVTVNCNGQRWPVPSNYDPVTRAYTGVWDGTFKQAWTNNPVWATYGLCVNDRFGLGKRIQPWMVDKWEMYRIGQYCDQLVSNGVGGMEPRYLCDLNLQGKAEAWTLLRDLSAIYRGMVYWAQGSLYMQADMPRAQDIDYTFTRSNVIDGDFVYGGAGRDTHYSRALVSYDNPANNYDTDVIPVTDNALQRRYRDRPIEISAIGCTRASEAQRRGKWALLSNNQDRTVSFKTGMEGAAVLPGFVIPVADELVAGRPNGGRISAAAGRTVTLDRDTPVKAGDRLIVNLPNGTAQARTVQSVAGRTVTVTTAYTLQPEPQLQWAIDYSDLAVQLFRVLKRKRTTEGEYEFTALEFNPSKFAAIDNGAKLEERPISVIPITTVPPPASVALTSGYAIDQGIAVSTMTIEWPAVEGAVAYDVEWRKDNGNWIRLQRVGTTSVDITGIYAGAYLARVRAVSAFDITSIWRDSMLTELKGKEGLPPSVTFLATESLIFSIAIRWGIPPGAEDTQRTELWYSQSNSLETATKLADLAYPQAEYVMQGLGAGVSFFCWARLVDRTGNIGPWYPAGGGVLGQSGSDASPVLELIGGQITESELGQELLKEIEKISGDFPGSVNDRINEAKQELEDLITELTDPLEYVATNAYAKDDAVRSGRRLYMAIGPVPAAADGSNAPPNSTYWVDIGSIAATANGLAQAVAKNTTDIATVDGKVTVTAAMLQAVQSAYRDDDGEGDLADAMRGWSTLAKVSEESRTRATQNEAMASRMVTVEARVGENTGSIRSLEQTVVTNEQATASRFTDVNTKVGSNTAGISQLEKAVTDNETSTASRLQTVNARVDDAETAISEEELARVTGYESLGQRLGIMEASFISPQGERDDNGEGDLAGALKSWESTAKIADESKVRATEIDVLARRSETLEVSIGDTKAAVQTVSQAQASLDGKASVMWSMKFQLNAQGQYLFGGIGAGIENGPGGLQSTLLFTSNQIAFANPTTAGALDFPFIIKNGQNFLGSTFIEDGTITNAKIGSFISSTNYVAGQQGWILNKAGTFEINGTVAGLGRLTFNNQRLRIFYPNGNLAIDLGINV
ncbi:phage tail protein [Pseudomonas putida]|uniref:Phage tail protein n=1 Tax=Pseudomonas putida TaxID=303 RepID=A0A2S3WEK4_PSEPU|nr:phage tail protein [Pseudomonas putida]POF89355.1 phage tail protein [Pseudomonas putida]